MDFTQYSQLLSYLQSKPSDKVLDIIGYPLPSSAENMINLRDADEQSSLGTMQYDLMLYRLALRLQRAPYTYLSGMIKQLNAQGIVILQDYVLPDDTQEADYINGLIHIFDKYHVKSFAQYAWDGLLLDVGLNIQAYHRRPIKMTIQQWIEDYRLNPIEIQHAQVMLVQAPDAVVNTLQLRYPGTPYAEFELQEIVCIAQKET
jgi:hypothetical protein